MIFKSYLLEQNLESINNLSSCLFYGENLGLKKEFKENLKKINNKNEILNLTQEDIIKNEDLLLGEIKNKSLFSSSKIIFINQANDKFFNILEEIIKYLKDDKLYIFADNLDKRSKLRSFYEKNKDLGIVPCYNDNEITIKKIITNKLREFKGLSPYVLNYIVQNTSLDRNKVNNEIEKIKSCFINKIIEGNKLEALLNIKINDDFNKLRDEALNGNKINTNRLLADTVFETENNIYYLNTINQRIYKLKDIEEMKNNTSNVETIISNLKPPIFWKDKSKLAEQSKKWNKVKINKLLKKTYKLETLIKSNSSIKKDLLIKNLIVDLCITANAS